VSEPPVRHELGQPLRELGSDDSDRRIGLEQQRHAALGHDTAADDDDSAMLQIREQR
jgi:hypothetical protein